MTEQREGWLSWIPANSELGPLIRDFDWAATSIGPIESWPAALRVPVSMCLNTKFPILVLWGPDLVNIYNDGYADMVGPSKHPAALGAPVQEVWGEIWDTIGPMFESVQRTGEPTWVEHQLLEIDRSGFIEECYFTFSYSPLFGGDGELAGILDISVETTAEVVAQRRLRCMSETTVAMMEAETPIDACVGAVTALRTCSDDVVTADLRVCVDDAIIPVASNRRYDLATVTDGDLRAAVDSGTMIVVGTDDPERPARHVVIPFTADPDGEVEGVLVATLNPQRAFDAEFRSFVELLAKTVGTAIDRARRRIEQLGEHRHINETLQQAMLSPVRDTDTIAARYVAAATNLSVGGDWYDVIDLEDHRRAIVVGDCVGHGLDAATAMSQLRSAARALLLEGADAAQMVKSLDVFATSVAGANCASVVCAIVDRGSRLVEYCRAGHPPPLVVGDGKVMWLHESGGTGLGIDPGQERTTSVHRLRRDDLIVMYTDGLVERRHRPIDDQLDLLASTVQELATSQVGPLADEVLRRLVGDDADDDVVIVVKRIAD